MIQAIRERRAERERLLGVAREYVERLAKRLDITAAAVAGSVARGDFNVWSDIDVVVVADDLPPRIPDRGALLIEGAPAGVQPIGFTPEEFERALAKGNVLVRDVLEHGVVLAGEEFFSRKRPHAPRLGVARSEHGAASPATGCGGGNGAGRVPRSPLPRRSRRRGGCRRGRR